MLKNILRVFIANGIVAVVGLLSSLFLPKTLSIEEYAVYQAFILYLGYVGILHLGFPNGLSIKYAGKNFNKIDRKQYKSELLFLILVLLVFSAIAICIAFGTQNKMMFYIAIMIFPYCFMSSFLSLFQSWGKFRSYAFLHIVLSAVPLALPIAFYFATRQISALLCIGLYISVYLCATVVSMFKNFQSVGGVKSNKIFSNENFQIEKLGFFFMLGNYINNILTSIDKQFIRWVGTTHQFSFYSFALTMQGVMTIFLTAISKPLFPYMVSGKITRNQYSEVKRYLLMLGSLSGVAYFACCLIVKLWIPDYIRSLEVIEIYFAVFPAMAVINCLYFNLYKTRKMTIRYIVDLLIILGIAAVADGMAVGTGHTYIGVCFVTTVIYYIWMFYGTFVFKELKFNKREILFLVLFLILFFITPKIGNDIIGAIVFLFLDIVICKVCFSSEFNNLLCRLVKHR
ncbi:MAG: lipopolysaccharide biosynthesis protein [Lachnospiraceae bacterium]